MVIRSGGRRGRTRTSRSRKKNRPSRGGARTDGAVRRRLLVADARRSGGGGCGGGVTHSPATPPPKLPVRQHAVAAAGVPPSFVRSVSSWPRLASNPCLSRPPQRQHRTSVVFIRDPCVRVTRSGTTLAFALSVSACRYFSISSVTAGKRFSVFYKKIYSRSVLIFDLIKFFSKKFAHRPRAFFSCSRAACSRVCYSVCVCV